MDFRNNNMDAFGVGQRRGGLGGSGGGGGSSGFNSAFYNYNNNMGNFNNGGSGGNNSNLSNFRDRMALPSGNSSSNYNSHSNNYNENINRDSLTTRNRSPPIAMSSVNRNSNFNSQFNNNSNYGNRNSDGFFSRNRSPSPLQYNSGGMMSNNANRSSDWDRGFRDNYSNTGNFGQQQMQGERYGQQNDYISSNNMNQNQGGQRRSLMESDETFAAKRRLLEDKIMSSGRSPNEWNNGGNFGNQQQSSLSQLNYGNRIYSDNPNPNFNLQNMEDNFGGGRVGRTVNKNFRQGEVIYNQSGGGNLDSEGFRGNVMYHANDRNMGRNNNGNMDQPIGLRDRNSSDIWQQPSLGNSNMQRANINSNQQSGYQPSSSDSWRASQRDFNANRNLNQNQNRAPYNKPATPSNNNRNNQQAANVRGTSGVGGGRSGPYPNNLQQKPQTIPVAKPQNVTRKPEQQIKKAVPVRPVVARPAVARPGVARPVVARPGVARPGVARPGVVRPGVARPVGAPGVARPIVRPGAARLNVARPGIGKPAVIRGRVARPVPSNNRSNKTQPGTKVVPVNAQKTAAKPATSNNANATITTNKSISAIPRTKAEKRQLRLARKRGFRLGGVKLNYINNKNQKLPQPEAESYALAFFEEKPIYTINVKSEEDEVAAAVVFDEADLKDDKTESSERPSRTMGKRARKQLRSEWSTLHDEKDYKNWKNWWTDYKRYGAEIHKEIVKLGCLNLEHCFLPYLPNSVNLTTEQVVHGVIKSGQFALGDLPGMPYDTMKSIVTLMNVTFLENLKSESDLEDLQDTIRSVPNDLWLFKMRSMVFLWVKYNDIINKKNDTEVADVDAGADDAKVQEEEKPKPEKESDASATASNEEGFTSYQWMAKQAFKNPCFHWLAMLAFSELETISEFAWPEHEKVFPTI